MTDILPVIMALVSSMLLSVGVILQKKGAGWMVRGQARPKNAFALFVLWGSGMILSYVLSVIPLVIASKELAPHIVSALSGVSIVIIAVLSHFFLKEELYASDILYSLLIIGCIALLSLNLSDTPAAEMNVKPLYPLLAFPLVLFLPIFSKRMGRKRKILLLALFSGFESGLNAVLMNVLAKEFDALTAQMFASPFLYLYLLVGAAAVAAAQVAYRIGDVILFTPLQMVSSICYPLVCSFFLFRASVTLLQILLILLMAAACWAIQRRR